MEKKMQMKKQHDLASKFKDNKSVEDDDYK